MNSELLNCPFERGQVWKNPENKLMMVTKIERYHKGWVVDYVTDCSQKGWFNNLDRAIIENCELLHCATPQIDVEGLKRNPQPTKYFGDDGSFVERYESDAHYSMGWNDAIDHLAASGYLRAPLERIEGLEEAIDVLEVHMQDMGDMAVVLVAARERAKLQRGVRNDT